jgi:KDO2-lipid IV(A) lauroyltransferase
MMKISHGFEYAGVWLLTKSVQLLPGRLADWLAVMLGRLAYYILTSRRRIAANNLRRAFGEELSDEEIIRIVKKVFINISRTTIEFARQPILTSSKILKMIRGEDSRHYLDRVLNEGKGAMLVAGHFGNWELMGGWAAALGYPLDFLVGQQHNRRVDELFVSFRRALGVGIIPVGVAARKVIKSLRANRMVAVVSDQHAASGGAIINFFNRPASTPKGPAAFAVKVGCPIIFGCLVREGYNKHRVEIDPPIYPPNSGDTEQDIQTMTQKYAEYLEARVRKYPEQWMWTHRRWKVD